MFQIGLFDFIGRELLDLLGETGSHDCGNVECRTPLPDSKCRKYVQQKTFARIKRTPCPPMFFRIIFAHSLAEYRRSERS